jgi:hypothetical protein
MREKHANSKINNDNAKQTWINGKVKAEEFMEKTIPMMGVMKHA